MSKICRHVGKRTQGFALPDQVIFDYTALMESLKLYKRPRDKVTRLLRDEGILRIKKGLYVKNRREWGQSPVREMAANLIYGPSYISLQFALAYYGMIPEAAVQVTSVTFKKTKRYHTPLGDFIYRSISKDHYLPGVALVRPNNRVSYLIASPEKALMDMLYFAPALRSRRDILSYLWEDLRLDEQAGRNLNISVIEAISTAAESLKLHTCTKVLEELVR